MDEQYLEQFSNDNLKKRFLNKDYIEVLEAVLADENSRFAKLEKIKSKLDFGKKVNSQDVHGLLPQIKRDVDVLLEVTDIREPSLSSFGLFDGTNKDIIRMYLAGAGYLAGAIGIGIGARWWKARVVKKGKTPSLVTRRAFLLGIVPAVPGGFQVIKGAMHHKIRSNDAGYISATEELSYPPGVGKVRTEMFLTHEYAHHVQKVMGFYYRKSIDLGVAIEGHARGVGKHIAILYSQERDNPAYLHDYLSRSIPELATAYVWLCKKFNSTPDAKARQFSFQDLSAYGRTENALRHGARQIHLSRLTQSLRLSVCSCAGRVALPVGGAQEYRAHRLPPVRRRAVFSWLLSSRRRRGH